MPSDLIFIAAFILSSFAGKFGNNLFCLWNGGMVSLFPGFYFNCFLTLA